MARTMDYDTGECLNGYWDNDRPLPLVDIDANCPVCEESHYQTVESDADFPQTELLACPTCGQWWADMVTYY